MGLRDLDGSVGDLRTASEEMIFTSKRASSQSQYSSGAEVNAVFLAQEISK